MIFISLSAACEKGPAPFIFPVREWVAGREAKAFNQLAHTRTPAAETLQQLPECFGIVLVPFGRKVLGQLPQHIGVKFFDTAQPGLEGIPSNDAGIRRIRRKDAAQRRVGEIPVSCVETVALIDERGGVFALAGPLPVDDLPAIGIAAPFVEGQSAGKNIWIAHPAGIAQKE